MAAFICEQCGTAFTAKKNLSRHLKKHDNKKFTCDQCDEVYETE